MVKKKTTKEFVEEAITIHNDKYNYDKVNYINIDTPVKIYCNSCNVYFIQSPYGHIKAETPCKECRKMDKFRGSKDQLLEKCKLIHNDNYDYSQVNYITIEDKVDIFCKKCNKYFSQEAYSHMNGSGCANCATKNRADNSRKTIEKFILEAKLVHGNKYSYDNVNYITNCTKISIFCNTCHNYFLQTPNNHIRGSGCQCMLYKNENKCKDIIQLLTGKKFYKKKPKWLHGLELDGYNPSLKLAFEYNGEQHYNYKPFFHREGVHNLWEQQERDMLKRYLCKKNNIRLIVIPYWIKDLKSYIQEKLYYV